MSFIFFFMSLRFVRLEGEVDREVEHTGERIVESPFSTDRRDVEDVVHRSRKATHSDTGFSQMFGIDVVTDAQGVELERVVLLDEPGGSACRVRTLFDIFEGGDVSRFLPSILQHAFVDVVVLDVCVFDVVNEGIIVFVASELIEERGE